MCLNPNALTTAVEIHCMDIGVYCVVYLCIIESETNIDFSGSSTTITY